MLSASPPQTVVLKALSANRYPAELSALGHIQYDADTNHSIVANIIIHLTALTHPACQKNTEGNVSSSSDIMLHLSD
jgi:hypothetical protein